MLVKIVEDAHEIALHYSSTQLKESNNEAIQAWYFITNHAKHRLKDFLLKWSLQLIRFYKV
jgi:hypothetical protein